MKTAIKLFLTALIGMAAYGSHAQCPGGPINYYFIGSGGQVTFIDSANMNLWVNWNFGDGDTANNSDFQVSHTYAQSGTYHVCITVSDTPACITTYCDTIQVNLCSGIAGFYYNQTGFGNYSFAPYNYLAGTSLLWDFGDSTTSTSIYPTHQYATSGSYTVKLVVIDAAGGCADSIEEGINITLCSFPGSFSYDSLGNSSIDTFTVVSPVPGYTYSWTFGDGSTGSGDTAIHQYNQYANYSICLITSDAGLGCSDTSCIYRPVDPCSIYATGINENINGLIASFSVGFSWQSQGQAGLTYAWATPGAVPATSTSSSPTVNYNTTGTFTALVIVTNQSGCSDTISQAVNITSLISYYPISGSVTAGGSGVCGTVYLITQDSIGHLALLDSIINIDSVNYGCGGQYLFNSLPPDTYYVKAALNVGDPNYANYLPTYYGDVLHWTDATPVVISNAGVTANIDLVAGSNPGGPGFVSGWISQGAGLVLQQGGNNYIRGAGSFLAGVQVNLLTSNNDPVAYTYSDANGKFTFTNLAYNSYKIYVERLNVGVVPDTFTLNAQNPGDTTLSITVDSNTATSITNVDGISVSAIFPNPVSTVVDIEISSKLAAEATLTLNDMLGQTIAMQKMHLVNGLNKGELNMANLASGVYQVVLEANNQRLTYKVVKAK